MNWISLTLLLLASILSLLVGFIVLARDPRKLENIAFFCISVGITAWAIGIAGFLNTQNPAAALLWAKFYYFAPILIVFASVLFAQYFLYRKKLGKYINGALFMYAIAIVVPLFSDRTFITDHIVFRDYGKQVILNPKEYLFYSLFLVLCFVVTIRLTYLKATRGKNNLEKQQAKIFLIGYTASCILGVFFNLVLPGLGNYGLIAVGPPFTTIFVLAVTYAIAKHKLFDVRLVVARSLGYASSLLLLSLIYGLVIFGIANNIFKLHLSVSSQIFLSVTSSVMSLIFGQFRKRFDRFTNRIFYQDAYDSQQLFDNLNKVLVSTTNLDHLLQESSIILAESLKSSYCSIALRKSQSSPQRLVSTQTVMFDEAEIALTRKLTVRMHEAVIMADKLEEKHLPLRTVMLRNNVSVIVRMAANVHHNDEGLGYILLGSKKSGNPYTNQDAIVLNTVAKELILAVQNALRFEEIQNFNLTLVAKVDAATRKLRNANEKLKVLDESKDDFISMASHQLRTPLTSVKGYISLVLEGDAGKLTPLQKQMLEQSYTSSQRMVYLIADLLNVSRLKTGKFLIDPKPVNLAELVNEEIAQLKETAKSRQLSLDYVQPKDFPKVMLDETKIRQVVMNFADNAIYYTPAGGKIKVELVNSPTTIELRIVDNGLGVPKFEQPHLFTKFYRAGNARKARPDGTGLGLFMAKKVIAAQGGALIFESTEGKGSTFGFVFSKHKLAVPETPVK